MLFVVSLRRSLTDTLVCNLIVVSVSEQYLTQKLTEGGTIAKDVEVNHKYLIEALPEEDVRHPEDNKLRIVVLVTYLMRGYVPTSCDDSTVLVLEALYAAMADICLDHDHEVIFSAPIGGMR